MSAVPATKLISIEDYLAMEEESEVKHEYYQGEVFAMAGGTIDHNQITTNAIGELHAFLKDKNCRVFNSDQKIHTEANTLFTYPDVSIVWGEPERWNNRNDTITNPSSLSKYFQKKQRTTTAAKSLNYIAAFLH
jgi:Uma2 family endonuclease